MADLTPGFYNLGLRIFQADPSQIEYLKGEQEVELQCCHACLQPVSENFRALLMFLLPNRKSQALEEMEKVHQRFPKNLNTLANLAYMYNERKMIAKENECRKKIDEMTKTHDNEKEKARSLAEQGYIMMVDLHSETREGPEKTLNTFAEQILEHKRFSRLAIEISNCEDILKYVSVIKKKLHGLQTNCHRETLQEKLQAMKKLHRAIKDLETLSTKCGVHDNPLTRELAVWKHYLGKSYIRISGGSSEIASKIDKKEYIKNAVKSLVSALQLETDTADKGELRIVARTYAYIAFIYIQKSHLMKGDNYLNNLEIKNIKVSENPLLICDLAEEVNNKNELKDRVVLNKIGVIHASKQDYDTSETFFQKSLEVVPDYNWFAYSYLCNIYLSRHIQSVKEDKKKTPGVTREVTSDCSMLQKAKEYGIKCLDMRQTSVTLFRLAKVCKYMGELKAAIEYLQTALRSHECERHSQIYAQLASCWYETGEFQGAVHMMKIAITIEPKNLTDPVNFRDFLGYLLEGFRKGVKQHAEHKWEQKSSKLREICCITEEGYRKHKKRINYQLTGIINVYPEEFIEVLMELLKQLPTGRRAELMEMCVKALKHHKSKNVKRRLSKLQENIDRFVLRGSSNELEETEEMFYTRQISVPVEFEYDFYVLVSASERAWVENIFLDVIEKDYNMTETILKGRLYHPQDDTEDIMKIMRSCKKFVYVISKDFTTDQRIEKIAQIIYKLCIDEKEMRVIPILRESVKIPHFLATLIPCEADDIFKIRNAICGLTYTPDDTDETEDEDENDAADDANTCLLEHADEDDDDTDRAFTGHADNDDDTDRAVQTGHDDNDQDNDDADGAIIPGQANND